MKNFLLLEWEKYLKIILDTIEYKPQTRYTSISFFDVAWLRGVKLILV